MPRAGLVRYEDLLRGGDNLTRGFAPNLVDVNDQAFSPAVGELKAHVTSILTNIERNRRPVEKFVIGKTFARKKPSEVFNHMDFDSWNLYGGVNGAWNNYERKGFDGLVVICAVTRNVLQRREVDDDDDEELYNHHDYALALKQQLVHFFAYDERDRRLGNSTLGREYGEEIRGKGAVLYVAFKLEEKEE